MRRHRERTGNELGHANRHQCGNQCQIDDQQETVHYTKPQQ